MESAVDEVVRPRQFERDDSKCSLASIRTVHRVSRTTPPSQRRSPTRRSRTCARVHPSTSDSGISNAGNDDVLASRSTGMSDARCEYSTMSCHPSACSRASRRTPSWLNPARSATCRDAAFVVECCSSTRRSPMLCATSLRPRTLGKQHRDRDLPAAPSRTPHRDHSPATDESSPDRGPAHCVGRRWPRSLTSLIATR